MKILATKRFTDKDQQRFAGLSGDRNPIHIDAVFARRTQFGRPIVHGVHTLIWALETLMQTQTGRLCEVRARFIKPIYAGDEVNVVVKQQGVDQVKLDITICDLVAVKLTIAFSSSRTNKFDPITRTDSAVTPLLKQPAEETLDQMSGREGNCQYEMSAPAAAAAFPALTRSTSEDVICGLLLSSYVIGMECPGLHSMLSEMSLCLPEAADHQQSLAFSVESVDPRFRLVTLQICGFGISGKVTSFVRQPPVRQPGMLEIKSLVTPGEFAGSTVLIVGGSRGLGEITAKIIAAGGGVPIITFAVGHDEAAQLAAEIHSADSRCEVLSYDVLLSAESQLADLPADLTHFYYFPTCAIFRRKQKLYQPDVMREFIAFYVDGLFELCNALRARQEGPLTGFFPSTVAIEQPVQNLTEYAAAKLAGESLCAQISAFTPNTRIVVKRLPRILTDQTATIAATKSSSPLETMLPIVREVQAA